MSEFYKGNRYTYDTESYERTKQQLEEFLFYRKKFEQSQRAATNIGDITKASSDNGTGKGIPMLNLQNLDPRVMQ